MSRTDGFECLLTAEKNIKIKLQAGGVKCRKLDRLWDSAGYLWWCIKAVKDSYSVLVCTLDNINAVNQTFLHSCNTFARLSFAASVEIKQNFAVKKFRNNSCIWPSRCCILHSLDDAALPAANCIWGLLDSKKDIEEATNLQNYYHWKIELQWHFQKKYLGSCMWLGDQVTA